jgi:hypothetical protein
VTTAIFTLAGVIIGGLLTGAIQLLLKRRDEERARLVAARLVLDELIDVASAIKGALKGKIRVREMLLDKSLDEVWKEHRVVLAGEMDDGAWRRVSACVERTRMRVNASDAPDQGHLENWLRGVDAAIVDLRLIAIAKKDKGFR